MKFELTASEFTTFCDQLAHAGAFTRIQELENQATELRAELETVREDRSYFQERNERLINENNELTYTQNQVTNEVRSLKSLVKDLQDQLTPNRLERLLSQAFAFFRTGKPIYAIKEVRTVFNLGLKEAKDIVEGNFTIGDTKFIALSEIFRDVKADNVNQEVQRQRLYLIVGQNVQTADMDLILAGKFHGEEIPF